MRNELSDSEKRRLQVDSLLLDIRCLQHKFLWLTKTLEMRGTLLACDKKDFWLVQEAAMDIHNTLTLKAEPFIKMYNRDWYDKWTTEYLEWYENAKEKSFSKSEESK